jgi:hypothetical protein
MAIIQAVPVTVSEDVNVANVGARPASTAWVAKRAAHGQQEFTTNNSFTVPDGVYTLWVTLVGGGGGGGGSERSVSLYYGNGGRHGKIVIRKKLSVTPKQVLSVSIGGGGAKGTVGSNGSNGGTTTCGGIAASGGVGGQVYKLPSSSDTLNFKNAVGATNPSGESGVFYNYGAGGNENSNGTAGYALIEW